MDQASLHKTRAASGSIRKHSKLYGTLSKDEIAIQEEWKAYDGKIRTLQQTQRYLDKGGPRELEQLIHKWRTIAQQAAEELLGVFNQGEPPFLMEQASWGYWGDDGEDPFARESRAALDKQSDQEDAADHDPMTHMLTRLRIDPEIVHYSAETNSFYD